MKKVFIFILLAVMALPVIPVRASSVPVPCEEEIRATVNVTVVFGRLKKGCGGYGICQIFVEWGMTSGSGNNPSAAEGSAWIENGKLKMNFRRSSIESNTFQTYFGENIIKMEEDFVLPAEVATALGIDSYTIKSGNYTIGQSPDSNILPVSF